MVKTIYNISIEYYVKFPINIASKLSKIRISELKKLAQLYGYKEWPFVSSTGDKSIYYKTIRKSPLNQIADYILKQEETKSFIPVGFEQKNCDFVNETVKNEPFYEYFNNEPINV